MENTDHTSDVRLNNVSSVVEQRHSDLYNHEIFNGSTVTFNNICYQVKIKQGLLWKRKTIVKDILCNVNGVMRPGMNAIMGPTGSGKSSLLDILAARKDPTGLKGQVLVDGAPQPANFKCTSGYVVQDDVVMGTLTVRENFQFSAALRLPKSIGSKEKNERINQVIKELGLTKVADSKVGTPFIRGVSGGERKRTNIGMELIIDPSVLFLDEPTTGLDASTALAVLLLLQRMSRKGRTIIFSIHQPRYSIFKLFGSLTLLANGRVVFHGPSREALNYFSSIGYTCEAFNNPADFFLDIINGDSTAVNSQKPMEIDLEKALDESDLKKEMTIAENLAEEFSKSSYYEEMMSELKMIVREDVGDSALVSRKITYATSFFHQLKWVTKRSYKNLLRNPQASIAQVMVSVMLGLIVGALFFGVENNMAGIQNRVGAMFFLTTNQCFTSISVIELFVIEKKIFIHEYISGYYMIISYFLAKLFVDLIPMRAIPSMIFTIVIYFMIGLKLDAGAFFITMLTLIQVSITATSMGLAVATGQNIIGVANLIISILFVIMILFSGLLVNLPSVINWLAWLQYLSIPRYGLTALEVNEFVGLTFCNNSELVSAPNANIGGAIPDVICTGEQYLERQGIEASEWGLWQNHLAMASMMIILFTISYLKLRFMKKFS
ncbi:broad substrate specificity ATP-binding cassette transporter ABCG2-like [Pristis pectinata]|uniref:broad substrate specificity ATP-binding cassette transporter ABCG2-like n=1 Tax=Pristis pectinata TaxID=685728 RepID=UPI00223DCB89|nr:broad substrate specificity ATP-binding cassette transporter ABCG2-like [Pristis pectinata]XP_051866226.1 broad substrate specificity ATP-binding cassette transporter ABCG2-like [Pristis pectinata]XP_051866228.1 broad substrate specificity ATP-binding cassette transporter ABCG2-like [Pristis pectinata]XP_051866229.1 broad substrate specificity ATP-binding cassette transporter ABCG2-like [Pristis pectinata]XP_051866230.1 broad substrate specificity ATP-binding cassette transporter ABCG2-like 